MCPSKAVYTASYDRKHVMPKIRRFSFYVAIILQIEFVLGL